MTLDAIKTQIARLPADAQAELASWLNLRIMDAWDREMQKDFSPVGRGYHVVERVKGQIHRGQFQRIRREE